MGKISGNKGEWSELYVLIYLLAQGRIHAADENLEKLQNVFFPIMKILREDVKGKKVDYVIPDSNRSFGADGLMVADSVDCMSGISIYLNGDFVGQIGHKEMVKEQQALYDAIIHGPGRAFTIDSTEDFMKKLHCEKIKASSTDKADIMMQIHDVNTGYEPICGFSIKSDLGNPPTLLNASEATNFIYKISGLNQEQAEFINAIETKKKILDRLDAIYSFNGHMEFSGLHNNVFHSNLLMIDSLMQNILAHILLYSYRSGIVKCSEVLEAVELENPMHYPRSGIYTYKFKKFLCAVALGMMPSKDWSGYDEANGGYIIVKSSGDVVAYHIYNRNSFEDYLMNNTKFERGSTSRHKYASIYENADGMMINLNLQIRFA